MIARPSVGPTFVVASSDKSKASQEVAGEERGRRSLSAFLPSLVPPSSSGWSSFLIHIARGCQLEKAQKIFTGIDDGQRRLSWAATVRRTKVAFVTSLVGIIDHRGIVAFIHILILHRRQNLHSEVIVFIRIVFSRGRAHSTRVVFSRSYVEFIRILLSRSNV